MFNLHSSIGEVLLHQASIRADGLALRTRERSWTYSQLADDALRVASGFNALGLRRGDVVGVWTTNRAEFVLAWFGSALAGLVVNPANPKLTTDEAAYVFTDSGAKALCHAGIAESVVQGVLARCPGIVHLVALSEDDGAEEGTPFTELLGASPAVPIDVRGSDLATLIYTSGTTGRPKGVMLEHRHSLWDAAAYAEVVPISPGEAALTVLPLFHVNAQLVTTLVPLIAGGTSALVDRFSPSTFWSHVEHFQPVYVSVVPTILSILLEADDKSNLNRETSLRAIVVGAAPLSTECFTRFESRFGVRLIEGYGLTECACVASANPYFGTRKIGSVGLPLRGCHIRIVNEGNVEQPAGMPGEIVIRGPNVMRGYWQQPSATADVLRDGWLHTGDVGVMDDEGYVFIVDRMTDMIISGGENIYPSEVERVLETHPTVVEAAVFGVAHPIRGEEVLAVVVTDSEAIDVTELHEWLSTRLAPFKCPRRFVFAEGLPRTASGKVQKHVLKKRVLEGQAMGLMRGGRSVAVDAEDATRARPGEAQSNKRVEK